LTLTPLTNSHRLYWIDESSTNQSALQAISIPSVNIGQIIAKQFQSVPETKWLGHDVESYLKTTLLECAAIKYNLSTSVLAISNLGILFEPALAINPSIWLKRLIKELTIILMWPERMQSNGLFYWPTSIKQPTLNLTDAAPQRLLIIE
jgi:hypothetical protein